MIYIKGFGFKHTIKLNNFIGSYHNLTVIINDEYIYLYIIKSDRITNLICYDQIIYEKLKHEHYLRHIINMFILLTQLPITYIDTKDIIYSKITTVPQSTDTMTDSKIYMGGYKLNTLLEDEYSKFVDQLLVIDIYMYIKHQRYLKNQDLEFTMSYLFIERCINQIFDNMINNMKSNNVLITNLRKYKTIHHKIDLLFIREWLTDDMYQKIDTVRVSRNDYIHYLHRIDDHIIDITRHILSYVYTIAYSTKILI